VAASRLWPARRRLHASGCGKRGGIALRVAVREARAAEWSWDRISAALGGSPNGETLRRNFGADEGAGDDAR
jgi:hypothetical protein